MLLVLLIGEEQATVKKLRDNNKPLSKLEGFRKLRDSIEEKIKGNQRLPLINQKYEEIKENIIEKNVDNIKTYEEAYTKTWENRKKPQIIEKIENRKTLS